MREFIITTLGIKDEQYHREEILLHDGWEWLVGDVQNLAELIEFINFTGIKLELLEERPYFKEGHGIYRQYKTGLFYRSEYFTKLDEIPTEARPHKVLSNGSLVDGYILVKDGILRVYRPNPNYKDIYKKMSLEDELQHRKTKWYL